MMQLSTNGTADPVVLRGLAPRIHPLWEKRAFRRWIAGSSPAMTNCKSGATA
jgi:hypothetical protein